MPSAVSVPLKPLFRCDSQCSEKTLSYLQLASVVVIEGDEAHTRPTCVRSVSTNTCTQKEKSRCEMCSGDRVVEKKAYRGRMWNMMGKEPYLHGMWEYFLQERSKVKRFRGLADEEKQAGIQGLWQQESPAKKYLEQVKCCHYTDCNEPMMKKGFTALKNGNWEEW